MAPYIAYDMTQGSPEPYTTGNTAIILLIFAVIILVVWLYRWYKG